MTFLRNMRLPELSLPLRLVTLASLLCAPILWYATGEQHTIDRDVARQARIAYAIDWIAMSDDLMIEAGSMTFARGAGGRVRVDDPSRKRIEGKLAALDAYALRHAGDVPALPLATGHIAKAWASVFRSPDAGSLTNLVNVTFHMSSNVSDGSTLSFESNMLLANLGDLLDNAYLLVYAPLGAGGQVLEIGLERGGVTLDDRIAIAGLLARARGAAIPVGNDTNGAPGEPLPIPKPLYEAVTATMAKAERYENALGVAIRRPVVTRDDRVALALGRADTLAASSALVRFVHRDAMVALGETRIDSANRRDSVYAQAALLILFASTLSILTGIFIVRRDRRELNNARHKADALAAELGRQEAERLQMMTAAQFDAVFDRSQMGIALLARDGTTIESNPALCAFLGNATPSIIPASDRRFADLVAGREATYQFESALENATGGLRWAQITVSSIDVDRSEQIVAIAMIEDITERRAIEQRLRYDAAHDHLTALPNRTTFLARLEYVLQTGVDLERFAVLFIDLDKFKFVNDTLGHPAGDRAISIAAQRLVGATRPGDLVARLHGDEFAVLLENVDAAIPGRVVADRITSAFKAPITLDGTPIVLTASVGIVAGLDAYRTAEHVMRDADVAMYNAKKLGRSTAVVFDGIMQERLGAHVRMLSDVRLALDRNEFYLVYQPIVNLVTGKLSGVEALMRWRHPTMGEIMPIDFIPTAEESDAIQSLGRLALSETCRMLARLDARGLPKITASVNLSVSHLASGEVVRDVRKAIESSGVDPKRLMLEITESGLLENGSQAERVLADLSALGARLCIDDFGTGYSSLRYLHEYPIDVMKIDRSFVSGDDGRVANEPIVQMLLTLARALRIDPIAEGIETEVQRQALLDGGCPLAQGYLFSRPISEDELAAFIEQQLDAHVERTVA